MGVMFGENLILLVYATVARLLLMQNLFVYKQEPGFVLAMKSLLTVPREVGVTLTKSTSGV